MPRIKSLRPRVYTFPFLVKILDISYEKTDRKSRIDYLASCIVTETKGSTVINAKAKFKIDLWLTEEGYYTEYLHINDIVFLSEDITWRSKGEWDYHFYDAVTLSKASADQIQTDKNGRPYVCDKVYPFAVSAPRGTWRLYDRYSDEIVAKVGRKYGNTIKLYFDSEEELCDFNGGEFYIDNDEYEALKYYDNQIVCYQPFLFRVRMRPKSFILELQFDEITNKWIMTLNPNPNKE